MKPMKKAKRAKTKILNVQENPMTEHLERAWQKYVYFFGAPPHGTSMQLAALASHKPLADQPQEGGQG